MKVVYWKCEKEGFAIAGYASSLDEAEEAAKNQGWSLKCRLERGLRLQDSVAEV